MQYLCISDIINNGNHCVSGSSYTTIGTKCLDRLGLPGEE